ncbi:methylated-DNA--[protein]-cysteine S-methyltransferase [Oceanobacillus massiliensis]|uniref:methylated-DNA--[protein]-cysteine S-methyltransferase n=1 Tax=Oceanobacillus massiliensis TaxID=1465765 RepID=UPI00028A3B0E|nr:methylated-DNA--[protein]-cysteine S-methyltransferase [Oceanobacillus massiliensis]
MNKNTRYIYFDCISTNNWNIYIAATDDGLCFVGSANQGLEEVEQWMRKHRHVAELIEDTDKLSIYKLQLEQYLKGERERFDLPIDIAGTPFQREVWNELKEIPYGHTATYSEIAEKIDRPSSVRAVATAIGSNAVMIVIPCHRVISKNGKMAGYRGGISMKSSLLELEQSSK